MAAPAWARSGCRSRLRDLSLDAGFGSVRRVPMDNPFNALYEIRQ